MKGKVAGTMKGKPMSKQMENGDEEDNGEEEEEEEEEEDNSEEEEEEEKEEEDEEDEDTEKAGCAMKKSKLSADDLQKSLDKLEAIATADDPPSRREQLLAQASDRELSKSERVELFELLGGESATTEDPGDEIVKSMEQNEELAKALDVSDYLQEQHTELVKSLRAVGEKIRESDNRHHEFGLVLARAVHDIGSMVKSLAEQVDAMGSAPARAPKSLGVRTRSSQVMQKSFANGPSGDESEQLTKSDVLTALDGLMQDSMQKGNPGATPFGEDITLAVAKYEQTHQISKPMLNAVMSWRQEQQKAAAH